MLYIYEKIMNIRIIMLYIYEKIMNIRIIMLYNYDTSHSVAVVYLILRPEIFLMQVHRSARVLSHQPKWKCIL